MTLSDASAQSASNAFFSAPLSEVDPEISAAIDKELGRQRNEIELIASENIVSKAVLDAQGSVLTNKYAEGYPGRRYYGGCQYVDIVESLAIERVTPPVRLQVRQCAAEFRQPGQPGGVPGADAAGRHVHRPRSRRGRPSDAWFAGQSVRQLVQAGRLWRAQGRPPHRSRAVARLAQEHKPKLIIAGGSGYPRFWDFEKFRADRRFGRRLFLRRHGAFRRSRGGRRASVAVPACACRHLDDAQDLARSARRPRPHQ